jgi:hypothetical protein
MPRRVIDRSGVRGFVEGDRGSEDVVEGKPLPRLPASNLAR